MLGAASSLGPESRLNRRERRAIDKRVQLRARDYPSLSGGGGESVGGGGGSESGGSPPMEEPTGEAQRADPRVEQLLDFSAEQLDGRAHGEAQLTRGSGGSTAGSLGRAAG